MKKMMKKIKSNSFISKTIAILTICMVLMSSFSVSAFAADDEVSASNEETESITDVWTSVMNWITSSLGTAQGVFVESSGSVNFIVLNSSDIVEVDIGTNFDYYIPLPGFDPSGAVVDSTYSFQFLNSSYNLVYTEIGSSSGFFGDNLSLLISEFSDYEEISPGVWYLCLAEPFSGTATLTTPFIFVGGSYQLTFLGTLAVIGLAIAIALLLISLISRFLRLRG